MKKRSNYIFLLITILVMGACQEKELPTRYNFDADWYFSLGDDSLAFQTEYDHTSWRKLNVPHDWSIEGEFSEDNPSTPEGGSLPTGIGWYRKEFATPTDGAARYYIDFDGVFQNSTVWLNGQELGTRPFGYIGFRYDITSFLKPIGEKNTIAVRVDNSAQPASRWYTGSGIYRHVWLVPEKVVHVVQWGTFITTPEISKEKATVEMELTIANHMVKKSNITIETVILDAKGIKVAENIVPVESLNSNTTLNQKFTIATPKVWSIKEPVLYTAHTTVFVNNSISDEYETPFGIRSFEFTPSKGFFLNGEPVKLHGVNQHHDLGALGAAVNTRAMERQLEILKDMGCNAIRMAHNPPAPELLDLCDEMGFLVIDESFDEWKKTKAKKGYHIFWDNWHVIDLQDMIRRDRNHPSIIAWSVGNEIREQFDSTGISITKELASTVKELDKTRPVTSALTEQDPQKNFIYQSHALDLLCFNYKHKEYLDFPKNYPGECMLASENMSALSTRGFYEFPSDSVRIWPSAHKAPLIGANDEKMVSAFDHVYAYWGATHEDTWNLVKSNEFIPGMFIWSGFDYIGEPIPYEYPARSSYLGIIDLCGFPKDVYYMYQSEWSNETMLHIYPHWNWTEGQVVDVWAYYNNADEVELFVNDISQGVKKKEAGQFHVMWRMPFEAGAIKAVSRKDGIVVLEKEIKTAGKPVGIELIADRSTIKADGSDLSFITVKVVDENGIMVPNADNLINFKVEGNGFNAGVDNGYQASTEPFKADYRKAFNGMCLLIVQSDGNKGEISIEATSEGLKTENVKINAN